MNLDVEKGKCAVDPWTEQFAASGFHRAGKWVPWGTQSICRGIGVFVRVHGMDHYVGPTQKNSKSSVRFTYSTPDKNKILSAATLPYYSLGLCLDSNFCSSNF